MKTYYSNIHPSRRRAPSVSHFINRVLERSGVESSPEVIDFIENAYMDAETMANTVKALKAAS